MSKYKRQGMATRTCMHVKFGEFIGYMVLTAILSSGITFWVVQPVEFLIYKDTPFCEGGMQ